MKKISLCLSIFVALTYSLTGCDVLFNSLSPEEKALRERYSAVYADVSKELLEINAKQTNIENTALRENRKSSHVASTSAFVYFISELYKNPAFTISESPVLFTCAYEAAQEEYALGMYTSVDEEKGKVLGEIYVETPDMVTGETMKGYIYIEVGYNFKTESILDFDLYMCDWETGDNVMRSLYVEEILFTLEPVEDESYKEAQDKVMSEMSEFAVSLETAIDLMHDFTKEYTASMQLLGKA